MTGSPENPSPRREGFSLVEILTVLALVAFIVFLAAPHILRVMEKNEEQAAVVRAQEMNSAVIQFIQDNGLEVAIAQWAAAANEEDRFTNFIASNLSRFSNAAAGTTNTNFIPSATNASEYMPDGYSATLPTSLQPLTPVILTLEGDTNPIDY